jgi:hypothetical protein
MKGFEINSHLNFGMYKGYELGIVYAFDPIYVEWCIQNIDSFYINDIEKLSRNKVVYKPVSYQAFREFGHAEHHILINEFKNIQDLNVSGINNSIFSFSVESKILNEKKKNLNSNHG